MAKQNIAVGSVVDDGTGDYLRKGGQKINANFDEVYGNLGDGQTVFASGAWKRFSSITDGNTLDLNFGDAYVIDTTSGSVTCTLPATTQADIGKTIKLRDVEGKWGQNPVYVTGDKNIKDTPNAEFKTQYADYELVYTGTKWDYAPQKLINSITLSDSPAVLRKSFLAAQDQRDFDFYSIISGEYNPAAFEIYRRGNLLYYGETLSSQSDYGSIPPHQNPYYGPGQTYAIPDDWVTATAYDVGDMIKVSTGNVDDPIVGTWSYDYYECQIAHTSSTDFADDATAYWNQLNNGDLMPPDGKTIRLVLSANDGDPIALVTYLTDISSFRSSFNDATIRVTDINNPSTTAVAGEVVKIDTTEQPTLSLSDFGYPEYTTYNSDSIGVYVNGTRLVQAGEAGTGDSGGGGDYDFDLVTDSEGRDNSIIFETQLSEGDFITIQWFDNVIGTLLQWDEGNDSIQNRGDARWIQSTTEYTIKNTLDYTNGVPDAATAEVITDETSRRMSTEQALFDAIYPVGTIYTNAHNPSNPADYMGFGTWVRYAEGKALTGWQDANEFGEYDPDFSLNSQWRDDNGQPRPAAGGTGGSKAVVLTAANIPELDSGFEDEGDRDYSSQNEAYALVARPSNGDINLNGCQPDPDESDVSLGYYHEEPIKVNAGNNPTGVSVLQPYVTAHIWVRTA